MDSERETNVDTRERRKLGDSPATKRPETFPRARPQQVKKEGGKWEGFHAVLSLLSYMLKAPLVPPGTPVVNALFAQRQVSTCTHLQGYALFPSVKQQRRFKEGYTGRPDGTAASSLLLANVLLAQFMYHRVPFFFHPFVVNVICTLLR